MEDSYNQVELEVHVGKSFPVDTRSSWRDIARNIVKQEDQISYPPPSLCAVHVRRSAFKGNELHNWSRLAIYADRGVIVLNKPPYLICQASDVQGGEDQKPRERNVDKFNDILSDLKDHFHLDKVPHTVHRLDKSTTGALVLAKNLAAARQLSQQFHNRTVGKTYLALVRGGEKSFQARSGEIRDPIETDGGHVSISQSCSAKFAATDWELVASSPKAPLSLLKLTLHTGLKHQLRVHLAHSLHAPILGDPVYSRSPISEKIARTIRVPENRMFLHASRLCFSRFRKTGLNKHLRLEVAAALPSDFVTLCMDAGIPLDKWDITGGLFVDGKPAGHEIPDLDGKWLKPSYLTTSLTHGDKDVPTM